MLDKDDVLSHSEILCDTCSSRTPTPTYLAAFDDFQLSLIATTKVNTLRRYIVPKV